LEAVLALAVGDHTRRLRDREAELAKILEGRAVQGDLIAGRDGLDPAALGLVLRGNPLMPPLLGPLVARTGAENRADGATQDPTATLVPAFGLRALRRRG